MTDHYRKAKEYVIGYKLDMNTTWLVHPLKKRVPKTSHYRIPEILTRENSSTKLHTDFKQDSAMARIIGRSMVANALSGRIGVISVTRLDIKVEPSLSCTSGHY